MLDCLDQWEFSEHVGWELDTELLPLEVGHFKVEIVMKPNDGRDFSPHMGPRWERWTGVAIREIGYCTEIHDIRTRQQRNLGLYPAILIDEWRHTEWRIDVFLQPWTERLRVRDAEPYRWVELVIDEVRHSRRIVT